MLMKNQKASELGNSLVTIFRLFSAKTFFQTLVQTCRNLQNFDGNLRPAGSKQFPSAYDTQLFTGKNSVIFPPRGRKKLLFPARPKFVKVGRVHIFSSIFLSCDDNFHSISCTLCLKCFTFSAIPKQQLSIFGQFESCGLSASP